MDTKIRRSFWNSIRIEEEFTNRQIFRILAAASIYIVCATFLLCVFYVYVLHPSGIGKPSLLNFASDFRARWTASPELGSALRVWLVSMGGMSALFALATGLVVSKKLAGPIYRIKMELAKMTASGEAKPITLRENDELVDVADAINRAIERLTTGANAELASRPSYEGDEHAAGFATLRQHLAEFESLRQTPIDAEALASWATRMNDLLDKADPDKAA